MIRRAFQPSPRSTLRKIGKAPPTRHILVDLSISQQPAIFPDKNIYRLTRTRLFSAISNVVPEVSNERQEDEDSFEQRIRHSQDFLSQSKQNIASLVGTNETKEVTSAETEAANNNSHQRNSHEKDVAQSYQIEEFTSKPVPGGNWDIKNPLGWASDFGRRSREYEERLRSLAKLQPGDEGYFDIETEERIPGITIVRTKEQARIVMEKLSNAPPSTFHACDTEVMDIDLKSVGPVGNGYVTCVSVYSGPDFDYGLGEEPGSVLWIDNLDNAYGVLQEFKDWFENDLHLKVWHNYGFDRHVMWNEGINVKGFGGDTMHMARLQDTSRTRSGSGNGYGLEALTTELLQTDDKRKKDEEGSNAMDDASKVSMKELFGVPRLRKDGSQGSLIDIPPVEVMQRDPLHRKKWIEYSCRDAKGTWLLRERLQEMLQQMVWYDKRNLYDYYFMHMRPFGEVLTDMERRGIRVDARDYLAKVERQARQDRDYHSRQFREWAMGRIGADGLALNPASAVQLQTFLFGGATNQKTGEYTEVTRIFRVPRDEIPEEALSAYKARVSESEPEEEPKTDELDHMTAARLKDFCKELGLKASGKKDEVKQRIRDHLLVGHSQGAGVVDKGPVHEIENLNDMTAAQLKAICREKDLKVSGKKVELLERIKDYASSYDESNASHSVVHIDEFSSMSDSDLKDALVARGLRGQGDRNELLRILREDTAFATEIINGSAPSDREGFLELSDALEAASKDGSSTLSEIIAEARSKARAEPKYIDVKIESIRLQPEKFTAGGAPSVTADVLKTLAGDPFADPPKYGKAYDAFNGGKEGHDACVALFSLCSIGSIDTMIANFLTSLQSLADVKSRVHCSLNLNTETGRLSSRRPNLQNQPALEKDKYKIRQAFEASPGNNLIVADYGQLELRLLASMTGCRSMIEAFEAGGDFHSRTALDMFDYVKQKVDAGECLLEWDYSEGDPPKPLLKDLFASERRKAKTLNFSIAYGKTAHGLSQDWGVTIPEAEKMLQAWYDARPEVMKWQAEKKQIARKHGFTRTLMGRYRQLPEAMGKNRKFIGHAERASINTPIQGGAADVAMMAMNKINRSQKLKGLGWILLLQIHDEVILEGPEETAREAFEEVIKCMEEPWEEGLPPTAVPLLVDGSYVHKNWYDAK